MKLKLKKVEYDLLADDAVKALYVEEGEDFKLDLEDAPEDKTEDVTKLLKALNAERDAHKETKHSLVEKLTSLEEKLKKPMIDEPEINSSDPNFLYLKKEMEKQKDQLDAILGQNETLKKEKKDALITEKIMDVANGKIVAGAMDDLKMYASAGNFDVTDEGLVVTSDGTDVDTWFSKTLELKPHWIPANKSAGAQGGTSSKTTDSDEQKFAALQKIEKPSPAQQAEMFEMAKTLKD